MQQRPLVFVSVTCVSGSVNYHSLCDWPNHSTVDIHLLSINPPVVWQVTVEEQPGSNTEAARRHTVAHTELRTTVMERSIRADSGRAQAGTL